MAEVAQDVRSCLGCVHVAFGRMTFCMLFRESILDERAAAVDCPGYEEDSAGLIALS